MTNNVQLTEAVQGLQAAIADARRKADFAASIALKQYRDVAHDSDVDDSPQPSEAAAAWCSNRYLLQLSEELAALGKML
jgi:hypothetical protein